MSKDEDINLQSLDGLEASLTLSLWPPWRHPHLDNLSMEWTNRLQRLHSAYYDSNTALNHVCAALTTAVNAEHRLVYDMLS